MDISARSWRFESSSGAPPSRRLVLDDAINLYPGDARLKETAAGLHVARGDTERARTFYRLERRRHRHHADSRR